MQFFHIRRVLYTYSTLKIPPAKHPKKP